MNTLINCLMGISFCTRESTRSFFIFSPLQKIFLLSFFSPPWLLHNHCLDFGPIIFHMLPLTFSFLMHYVHCGSVSSSGVLVWHGVMNLTPASTSTLCVDPCLQALCFVLCPYEGQNGKGFSNLCPNMPPVKNLHETLSAEVNAQ